MRKQRAWHKYFKNYWKVDAIYFDKGQVAISRENKERGIDDKGLVDFDEVIFEESIGLLDKNGTEIFEGDVVKGRSETIYNVVYKQNKGAFVVEKRNGQFYQYVYVKEQENE